MYIHVLSYMIFTLNSHICNYVYIVFLHITFQTYDISPIYMFYVSHIKLTIFHIFSIFKHVTYKTACIYGGFLK